MRRRESGAEEKRESRAEFDARYAAAKEAEIAKLSEEVEAKNARDTKKQKRNWWIKTVLMLLLIALSVALTLTIGQSVSGEGTTPFLEMLKGASWPCFLIFLAVFLLEMVAEAAKYAYLIKISSGKFHFKTAIKTMFLGRYYDGITPLATGGQPFQIYYLHKKDIPAGAATAIPLVRFIVATFATCLLSFVLFFFPQRMGLLTGWDGTVIMVVAWISVAVNFIVPIAIIFVSLFPRLGKKLAVKLVGFLGKLHIVKHKYPLMRKYVYEIGEYRNSLRAIIKSVPVLLPFILITLIQVLAFFSLPFFAVLAVAGPSVSDNLPLLYFQTLCLACVSSYSSSLVPTPGNSGANEALSILVFLAVSGISGVLGWAVLLWRFSTYYLYIISGIGINIFEIIRSAVRARRQPKV